MAQVNSSVTNDRAKLIRSRSSSISRTGRNVSSDRPKSPRMKLPIQNRYCCHCGLSRPKRALMFCASSSAAWALITRASVPAASAMRFDA